MRRFIMLAAVFACLSGHAVWAQAGPNADAIIEALKPKPGAPHNATRGIRPAQGPDAPAKAALTAPPEASPEAPSVSLAVPFRTGSAALTPEAAHMLDELGRALSSHDLASYRFRIEGHTDTVGSARQNQALSEARAATVAAYLEGKFGVTATRLETVGMGQDHPLIQTPPQTPEARNRRVQVVNLGA